MGGSVDDDGLDRRALRRALDAIAHARPFPAMRHPHRVGEGGVDQGGVDQGGVDQSGAESSEETDVADERWLVVGLGNPEDEYAGTRHNAGSDAVRRWAAAEHTSLSRNKKVRGEAVEVRVGAAKVALFVPGSYMNTSGGPVQAASRWFSAPPERIVVVHDEIDVELGQVRLKRGGGPGGHNGLRDVDRALGTRDYLRVRIGVGRPPGRMDAAAYVLRRFSKDEREQVDVTIAEVPDIVASLVTEGLEPAQNRYHAR